MSVIVFVSHMNNLDVVGNLIIGIKKVYIFVYVDAYSFICVHEVQIAPFPQITILPYSQGETWVESLCASQLLGVCCLLKEVDVVRMFGEDCLYQSPVAMHVECIDTNVIRH